MKRLKSIIIGCGLLGLSLSVWAQGATLNAAEILERVNEKWQGDSYHGVLSIEITLAGQSKFHKLEAWTLGEEYALIRILEPEIDLNSGYLELGGELWYYSPAVGSIKLPSLALSDALFGSGPSLSDLSHTTLSDDYETSADVTESGFFLILVPHEDAPVVYGKLELTVSEMFVIQELIYYDQRGELLQTATFSDVILIQDRELASTVTIVDVYGDTTTLRYETAEFDLDLDPSFFDLATFESWGTE